MSEPVTSPAVPVVPAPRARVGLVLAGGGAKGSYQVGVVECLAREGVRLSAVAGASIGALNAAIVSAAPTLTEAAGRLAAVWDEVGSAAGRATPGIADLLLGNPVTQPGFLEALLRRHVDPEELGTGLPLWVSVCLSPPPPPGQPDVGWLRDIVFDASAQVEWLHVNALPAHERHAALCASAALPLIMPPRTVGGVRYRDGGIADNAPISALIDHAARDLFIVVHLTRGVLWDARDYAPGRILEIRPAESLRSSGPLGGVSAMLDFTSERATALRRQGYRDAERALATLREVITSVGVLRHSQDAMLESLSLLDEEASRADPAL